MCKAVNYLTSTQQTDGSWLQDPYSTALGIKSPHLSENNPPPPEPTASTIINLGTIPLSISATTGIIKGTITDADSAQPLEGVTIEVTGSFSGSTVTGTDGSFIFTDVTPEK